MMADKTNWQASLIEQRIAWGTTFCAMVIALLAAVQPQWFDFSFATHSPVHKLTAVVQTPVQHQMIEAKTKTAPTAAVKAAPVKSAPIPPLTIKPITQSTPVTRANRQVAKASSTLKKESPRTQGFYVQLGAFEEKSRAQGMTDQLRRKGWSVKIATKKNGLHAVWIGPKPTKSDAEKLLKTIRSTLKYKGFIVQPSNG